MPPDESSQSPLFMFICSDDFGAKVKKAAQAAYDLGIQRGHNPGAFFKATQEGCVVQAVCKRCFGPILVDTNLAFSVPRLCRSRA